MNKEYLLFSVWQIARENLFFANSKILNQNNLMLYLHGPIVEDLDPEDKLVYVVPHEEGQKLKRIVASIQDLVGSAGKQMVS